MIMLNINLGWFIRSIHRWSSAIMGLFVVLHIYRVYLTLAFKNPREFIWITGIMVAARTVTFGVTGYSTR
jgi:cytochrome b6